MEELENSTENCTYNSALYLTEKFALVTVFGTIVCVVAIVNNSLLVHLLTRRSLLQSHVFFLAVLACCDIVVAIAYVLLMSVQILYDYGQNLSLYIAWNNYLRPVFALSHVSMTTSTYTIVAASAERYLTSTGWMKRNCIPRDRILAIVFIIGFAALSKGMVYWELDVQYKENCTGFETYTVVPSALAMHGLYKYVYMLWFRHMAHVFVPFVLLIILNAGILIRLKRTPMEAQTALLELTMSQKSRLRKKNVRAATRMLIALVSTYLISNLLNVVVTIWEHTDMESLKDDNQIFYIFATDTVNLLTVITASIRLPIYCACNKQLRRDLKNLINRTLLAKVYKARKA